MAEKKTSNIDESTLEDHRSRKRVSEILRDGRLSKDLELKDVADKLRIRLPFMEAIESGNYQILPGSTYAIGFVRGYADFLGIDSKKIIEQFKQEAAELERRSVLHFPEPLPGGRVPGGAIFFICIFLAVVFYGTWMIVSSDGKPVAEVISELPANLAEMIGVEVSAQKSEEQSIQAPAENIVVETTVPTVEPVVAAKDAIGQETSDVAVEQVTAQQTDVNADNSQIEAANNVEVAPIPENPVTENVPAAVENMPAALAIGSETINQEVAPTEAAAPQMNEVTQQESATTVESTVIETAAIATEESVSSVGEASVVAEVPVPAANALSDQIPSAPLLPQIARTPRVFGEENTNVRVVITANTPTWVEVTAPSGELLLTRLLGEKDSYRVPNIRGLTLVTGNAGGLNFTVDGQAVPNIGPIGSVKRDVLLDAESLKLGPNQ